MKPDLDTVVRSILALVLVVMPPLFWAITGVEEASSWALPSLVIGYYFGNHNGKNGRGHEPRERRPESPGVEPPRE